MNKKEFTAARASLGLSQAALARLLQVSDGRTVRYWESGQRSVPGPVSVLMSWLVTHKRPKL